MANASSIQKSFLLLQLAFYIVTALRTYYDDITDTRIYPTLPWVKLGRTGSLYQITPNNYLLILTPSVYCPISLQSLIITRASIYGYWSCLQVEIHLVATSTQEKAAWISDISECIANVQFNNFLRPSNDISVLPQNLRNNYRLSFQDEPTIIYSDARKSCKVPLIRYATPEKLLQHLIGNFFEECPFYRFFFSLHHVVSCISI